MDLNFDNERKLLTLKKTELLSGIAVIEEALAALDRGPRANGTSKRGGSPAIGDPPVRAGRKPMSAKAKKAARDRMLAYWAGKRAEAAGRTKSRSKPAR